MSFEFLHGRSLEEIRFLVSIKERFIVLNITAAGDRMMMPTVEQNLQFQVSHGAG